MAIDNENDLSTLVFMAQQIDAGRLRLALECMPFVSKENIDIAMALVYPEDATREALLNTRFVRAAAGDQTSQWPEPIGKLNENTC